MSTIYFSQRVAKKTDRPKWRACDQIQISFCFVLWNGYAFLRRTWIVLAPKRQQRLKLGMSGVA